MSLIVIFGNSFAGQRELAQALANHFGYRLVTPDLIIERAAAWGGRQQELLQLLAKGPGILDRFLRKTQRQVLLLRAALAEELRSGHAICYGELADLLLAPDLPVIRVHALASHDSRTRNVSWLLKYTEIEAAAFLKRADRARRGWLRLIGGYAHAGEPGFDIALNLDRADLELACDSIRPFAVHHADDRIPEDLALACRVRAALAVEGTTAHLDLSVGSDQGRVSIQGRLSNAHELQELERVVRNIAGVSALSLDGDRLESPQAAVGGHGQARRRPRTAYLALGLTLGVVLLISGLGNRLASVVGNAAIAGWGREPETTIVGLVTDSLCADHHRQDDSAQCVRACVARGGKYVLFDGKGLYHLSNQRAMDRFAASEVRVKGVLEKRSGYLRVVSVEPL